MPDLILQETSTSQWSAAYLSWYHSAPAADRRYVVAALENQAAGGGGGASWYLRHRNDAYSSFRNFISYDLGTEVLQISGSNILAAGVIGYSWSELTPGGGWANYGGGSATFGVRRFGDMVSIKGVLKATSSIGSGATVYTLPAEYRPSTLRQFPTYGSNGADRILISSTGAIQLSGSYATNQYVLVETTYFTGG